ncbi:hypothetical protein BH20VER1_BH20VER1_28660 [soil metagenome]
MDPDKNPPGFDHHGGNTIIFRHSPELRERTGQRQTNLHGFWDNLAVALSLPKLTKQMDREEKRELTRHARWELVKRFSTEEPENWRMPPELPLTEYAEAWANDIMPLAREAHERLEFIDVEVKLDHRDRELAHGFAEEKKTADGIPYGDWAAGVVREQLHRGGWRLADLLEKALAESQN